MYNFINNTGRAHRRPRLLLVVCVLLSLACLQANSYADGYTGPALLGWYDDGTCYAPIHVGFLFYAGTSSDFVGGVQAIAAGANSVGGDFKGVCQLTGIGANHVGADFYGLGQVALGANVVKGRFTGAFQLGIVNIADEIRGVQLGIVNKACILRGVQIGLINMVSDNALPFCPVLNVGW